VGHINLCYQKVRKILEEQDKTLPEEVIEIIASRTDGVPLFVEELTKTILETGVLRADGDRLVLDGPLDTLAIPSTLHDSLMARLDRLQPIKEVAQTAACIGRAFDHRLLASISPLPEADLNGASLGGADLSEASLRGANLSGANLRRANMRGAYLWEASNITDEQLAEAILDETSIMPDGSRWKPQY